MREWGFKNVLVSKHMGGTVCIIVQYLIILMLGICNKVGKLYELVLIIYFVIEKCCNRIEGFLHRVYKGL